MCMQAINIKNHYYNHNFLLLFNLNLTKFSEKAIPHIKYAWLLSHYT